jgi:hypothetical protein
MQFLYLPHITIACGPHIIVELVPESSASKLRAWELGKRVERDTVDEDAEPAGYVQ